MKLKVIPIKSWGASKLASHKQCPRRTQLRYAQHLCPLCFKGTVPYDGACSKCGRVPEKPPALARGIEMDEEISNFLNDKTSIHPERPRQFDHPKVNRLISDIAWDEDSTDVRVKAQISLGSNWQPLPRYTKGPWFWGELDVLVLRKKKAEVIDWKSGGIVKSGPDKGKVRESEEYQDQLEIYCVAVLCAHPEVQEVTAKLVFLDAKPPQDPVVPLKAGPIRRAALKGMMRKWEGRIQPLLTDTVFPPRPGWYCDFCDYSQRKGGPCEF